MKLVVEFENGKIFSIKVYGEKYTIADLLLISETIRANALNVQMRGEPEIESKDDKLEAKIDREKVNQKV